MHFSNHLATNSKSFSVSCRKGVYKGFVVIVFSIIKEINLSNSASFIFINHSSMHISYIKAKFYEFFLITCQKKVTSPADPKLFLKIKLLALLLYGTEIWIPQSFTVVIDLNSHQNKTLNANLSVHSCTPTQFP